MNDQLARSLFMDYLYEEINPDDRRKLEHYFENNPEIQKEFNEFRQVRAMLQHAPPVESPKQMMMVEPNRHTFRQWWNRVRALWPETIWGRTGFAAAAVGLLLFIISSFVQMQIDVDDAGFSISLGRQLQPEQVVTPQQLEMIMDEIRAENAAMMEQVVTGLQQENRRQLQEVVHYLEQERTKDIQAIKTYIEQYQQVNNTRWQQADEYLNQLYYSINR